MSGPLGGGGDFFDSHCTVSAISVAINFQALLLSVHYITASFVSSLLFIPIPHYPTHLCSHSAQPHHLTPILTQSHHVDSPLVQTGKQIAHVHSVTISGYYAAPCTAISTLHTLVADMPYKCQCGQLKHQVIQKEMTLNSAVSLGHHFVHAMRTMTMHTMLHTDTSETR